jgi:hypothetical protein
MREILDYQILQPAVKGVVDPISLTQLRLQLNISFGLKFTDQVARCRGESVFGDSKVRCLAIRDSFSRHETEMRSLLENDTTTESTQPR